jgi:hypothetical protein
MRRMRLRLAQAQFRQPGSGNRRRRFFDAWTVLCFRTGLFSRFCILSDPQSSRSAKVSDETFKLLRRSASLDVAGVFPVGFLFCGEGTGSWLQRSG